MSIDLTRFYASFFSESFDYLDTAEHCLLRIEQGENTDELLNALFRCIHSIKGSAGTLGFIEIARVCHELESLLDAVRNRTLVLTHESIGLNYAALDLISAMLTQARDQAESIDGDRVEAIIRRLQNSLNSNTCAAANSSLPAAPAAKQAPEPTSEQSFLIRFVPNVNFMQSGNDPVLYLGEISRLGRATVHLDSSRLPNLRELDPYSAWLGWEIHLSTSKSFEQIVSLFEWIEDLCDLDVRALQSPQSLNETGIDLRSSARKLESSSESVATTRADNDPGSKVDPPDGSRMDRRKLTVHVRADRLDKLINQISEIAIAHSSFKQSLSAIVDEGLLKTDLTRLDRQLKHLQDAVLGLRMLPVNVLFGRFDRIVRDAAVELGKPVRLFVEGADTELDKNLIEKLADPITHLVKNAIDHGLEATSERLMAGKNEAGSVTLRARSEGGFVLITVADDGRGIDIPKVRKKAIELGFASESDTFTDQQWIEFIFRPGFSTSQSLSHWSGRGVGMDIVQSNINALGGELSIQSRVGLGTQFSIRLPLTLAIIDALLVRADDQVFAIPMTFVRECFTASALKVAEFVNGVQMPKVNGEYVFCVTLSKYLEGDPAVKTGSLGDCKLHLLIQSAERKVLLGIDEILGQDQVVVRSLIRHFKATQYASGATILGDGKIALILDPAVLIRELLGIQSSVEISHA